MKALILAGGLPQIELINQLKERNIETILCDGNDNAIARPYADKFYKLAIFDIEAVKQVALDEQVDFLITVCADQVLLVVAQVSEMLGLPCYIDYQTAQNVSDKKYMKKIFMENNIPTSRYVELSELELDRISHLNYPLVVKPVDAYSSRGVRKVWNEEELKVYFDEAAKISRTGGVIVEEFVSGDEISVDIYVENGKAKVLCVSNSEKINTDNRFIIFRGRYPVNVTPEVYAQIEVVAQQIADAFKVGEHRAKNRVLRIINDDKYQRDRMFVYLKGYNTNKVKRVVDDYKRNLEYIHQNEIRNCLLTILTNSIGLTREGLTREAMNIFGHKNKSSRVTDFFNIHINRLLADNLISEIDGKLEVKGGN
jgi:hypothetical protein